MSASQEGADVNGAAAVIAALKERFYALTDQELAAELKIAKSTIASWRRRGEIPPKVARDIEQRFGITAEKALRSRASNDNAILEVRRRALFTALVMLVRERPDTAASDLASALVYLEKAFGWALDDLAGSEPYRGLVGAARMILDLEAGKLSTEKLLALAEAAETEREPASKFPT